jgi:hypothetical protein
LTPVLKWTRFGTAPQQNQPPDSQRRPEMTIRILGRPIELSQVTWVNLYYKEEPGEPSFVHFQKTAGVDEFTSEESSKIRSKEIQSELTKPDRPPPDRLTPLNGFLINLAHFVDSYPLVDASKRPIYKVVFDSGPALLLSDALGKKLEGFRPAPP